jgi:hypothetical protein
VDLPPVPVPPKRPAFQLTIWGLMVLMLGFSVTGALAYYVRRGIEGESTAYLVGMIVVLAGPMLLMTVISLLLALTQWLRQR